MQRGARVFEVTADPYSIKSWIRQEDGTSMEYNNSYKKHFFMSKQQICAKAVSKASLIGDHEEELKYLKKYYLKRDDLKGLL